MNYCNIKRFDIANGPGIRLSLFVSGCPYHCPGCFNQSTWDYNSGQSFTEDTFDFILEEIKKPFYKGFSILGGEPFEQSTQDTLLLIKLCREIKKVRPDISIWAWTGGDYNIIKQDPIKKMLLQELEVLVDGRFIESKKDLRLKYCGSTNQRVIDVQETRKVNKRKTLGQNYKLIPWEDKE